jgi:gas vesicle protein GvpN
MAIAARTVVDDAPTALCVRPRSDFVETPTVREMTERALAYLDADFPVHFRGAAGTGKTTLALHTAARLGRPVTLITGDEEFGTSDMIGGEYGYHYRKVIDRYVHSVLKYEEDAVQRWVDQRLTTACREGFTLVYDEFTRSRPEANNVLLAVLEEKVLVLPTTSRDNAYVKVHPEFRAIFTSNHHEYAGVHGAQDALSDRMITLDLDYYDRDTEIAITASRSGLTAPASAAVVDIVRDFRDSEEYDQTPTLRACIMIAKVAARQGMRLSNRDPRFVRTCLDVLQSKAVFSREARERWDRQRQLLTGLVERHCG